ncbi:FKBP-type peptidyl-prolyl cis-trans isomerase [Pseudoalteromonas mariniglutinosa]|uniref:FKBP-type peptidyl-prolyl cis-trans isomerase n=1 Tax=Pseudoalteromonas mariniglutinosa TaxID=206042 RepID=UPI00384AB31C
MINLILLSMIAVLCILIFRMSKKAKRQAQENEILAADFLANNSRVEGVQETPSGLQYKIEYSSGNNRKPSATSKVKVHYHGKLLDGRVFDSSIERQTPISFALNQVIAGWTEGLQLMNEGDKYTFYVPPQLGYANKRVASIPASSLLIFDVQLLAIES